MTSAIILLAGLGAVAGLGAGIAMRDSALPPARVLPPGRLPADTRLGPLRGERGDFSFLPAESDDQWSDRFQHVRRVMRVAQGLWPMPTKTPLHAVIHGKVGFDDYSVEKVYFESVPGFFVTGNLYRPTGKGGQRPAVLSPHGHFPGGRFQDAGRAAVRRQLVDGAERFEEGGRSFMQARCVQLARMGCIVFHYDMIGYGDCQQLSEQLAHRFSRLRVKFQKPPDSGLYSAAALLRQQNLLGLHTLNSIRALDFLTSLPEVDPRKLAVTGGSGGGTQTFMLCAVDDRPLVSVPVVIVSADRQGGCTCENICGLRIGTYNLEFTALHAPKPLLLISADDATRTMPERGFPELLSHYKTLGAEDNLAHVANLQFPHNYNSVSRAAMYHWLNEQLGLGLQEPILERSYRRLTRDELTVWNDEHRQPAADPDFQHKLLDWLADDSERQLAALFPRDRKSLARYREVVGTAWDILIRRLPENADIRFEVKSTANRGKYRETLGLLRYRTADDHRAELPVVRLAPGKSARRIVIWIDPAGKAGLYAPDGSIQPQIRKLLDADIAVVGVDLFKQGEFLVDGKSINRQRSLPAEEAFAGWTYCYNLPLLARRVHDVLAVIEMVRLDAAESKPIDLVGLGPAGVWAAGALVQAQGSIERATIDTDGFRFEKLTDVYGEHFLPGAVKYGDVPGLLALAAPTRLWVASENDRTLRIVKAAYASTESPEHLTIYSGRQNTNRRAAVEWLLQK